MSREAPRAGAPRVDAGGIDAGHVATTPMPMRRVPWTRLRGRTRVVALFTADGVATALCLWSALLLRFEGRLPDDIVQALPSTMLLLIACRLVAAQAFKLHRWSFRFSSLRDAARIGMAGLFGTGLFTLGLDLLHFASPPRSVLVLELLLSTLLFGGVRFAPRLLLLYATDLLRTRHPNAVRTLIVGAGAAGELLLRDLVRASDLPGGGDASGTGDHDMYVIGFVDDDLDKRGHVVGGKTVLGTIADLPVVLRTYRVARILIAIPGLPPARLRRILAACADAQVTFKILPLSYRYLEARAAATMLQDLTPEHILERGEVQLVDSDLVPSAEAPRLVTGAGGSIGREVCRQLLAAGVRHLVMVDIDESDLYVLKRRFEAAHPDATIAVSLTDVRDEMRVYALFARLRPVDVFHAAALKHVPLMEAEPSEAVKTNVLGTLHVARAARRFVARRMVFMSTDKAVEPTSVMGATKRLGELLLARLRDGDTHFCVVRFGNVLDSAGSVVPLFREQIARGGPVTVTHPEMRRFFMTIREAVGLVLRAAYGDHGPLCVLEMGEPIRIQDLARHMITMAGRVPRVGADAVGEAAGTVEIRYTGLRPGEKMSESLLAPGERVMQRVDGKIRVVEDTATRPDLRHGLTVLEQAARAGDDERVRTLLEGLVPEYRPEPQAVPFVALDTGGDASGADLHDEPSSASSLDIPIVVDER
ncbi:MAG: SDR family NAD(P)-dependent oxidoreductase [Acidobacteriota bacterium]